MLFKIHICYFHNYATKRHRKNLIERVRDEDGVWRDLPEDIKMVMINYYKDLFSSTNLTGSQVVLDCVPSVIIEEMNSFLSREFEESEVATALQQMAPLKAPGPDGMPPLFYQHFWGTVK